jgi:hypothetical protein
MTKPTSLISTLRHGKKNAAGQLEEEGKIQSARKGIQIEHLEGDIILFHSGEQRVKDTIAIIGGNLYKNKEEELTDYLETKFDLQDYTVPTLHFLKDRNERSNYFSNWDGETNENYLADFINMDSDFTEPERAYSSIEMASNLANILMTQIKFSTLTSEERKANFVNGSHEPVIMSFLYYVLRDEAASESVSEFIERIGGSINYTEGFDIKVFQNGLKLESLILEFRNIEKEITLVNLTELILP